MVLYTTYSLLHSCYPSLIFLFYFFYFLFPHLFSVHFFGEREDVNCQKRWLNAQLHGNAVFEEVTKNAVRGLWARRSKLNLVGAHINVFTGEWTQKVTFYFDMISL